MVQEKTKATFDLSTTVKGLGVGRVYLQGSAAKFQGFVWAVQTECSDRKVQKERKQRRPDPLALFIALSFPVPQQHHCLWVCTTW